MSAAAAVALALGCGGGDLPPRWSQPAWTLWSQTTVVHSRQTRIFDPQPTFCPDGGTVEGPGSSVLMYAWSHGQAHGPVVWAQCARGDLTLSGQAQVTVVRRGDELYWTQVTGRLRRHGDRLAPCALSLHAADFDSQPQRLVGSFCGHWVELDTAALSRPDGA